MPIISYQVSSLNGPEPQKLTEDLNGKQQDEESKDRFTFLSNAKYCKHFVLSNLNILIILKCPYKYYRSLSFVLELM